MLASAFFACKKEYPFYNGEGKKPVYITKAELSDIRNLPPQPTQRTGTIFLLDTLFFMLEQKTGIHIINLSDSSQPVKLTFIKIPAVNDFTVNGNFLYADNGPNLVTIDISNLYELKVLNVQEQVFQPILFPPLYRGFFECADTSKGILFDWVDTNLKDARCNVL